jgi:hypothetical protein
MPRSVAAALVALVALVAAGCSDDGNGGSPDEGAAPADEAPGTTVDQSPFCVTIRELEALGSEPAEGGGSPEEVLEQNDEVVALLEAARSSAPADAPPDVHALFEDYVLLSSAITTAGGDTEAAFAALQAEQPDLMTRLSGPDAHAEAFRWFSERCGTAPPG